MIVDVRIYQIVPRKMGEYLKLFEEYGLPVQRRHLGDPLGYFVTEHGQLHQVVSCVLLLLMLLLLNEIFLFFEIPWKQQKNNC